MNEPGRSSHRKSALLSIIQEIPVCDHLRSIGADDIMNSNTAIGNLKGVGEKTEKLFQKMGVYKTEDLIRYYPHRFEIYEDPVPISEVEENRVNTIAGNVFGRIVLSGNRSVQITTLNIKDLTGMIKVIWFRMPFLRNTLGKGGTIILRGRVVRKREGLVMEHPEIFYPASKYDEKRYTMQPVYSLTAGMSNNTVIKTVRQALEAADDSMDILPSGFADKYGFPAYTKAVEKMHFPENKEEFIHARERFVYEEFLVFILSLRRLKKDESRSCNHYIFADMSELDRFLKELPYELTDAQKKVWKEIKDDLQSSRVMSRLVQGDVGSGKTIVAFLGLLLAGLNGYQGALMAPTEVLAKQHYDNISRMLEQYCLPVKAVLLTGSMTAKQKRETYESIASGKVSIIIGTHALIQDKVSYRKLALVVTDEQHRFGVKQRERLASKGCLPHILVMSATPIPRTLAIILYGDLDISIIDEMPKNRLPIKNCVVDTSYRKTAYRFMKKQVEEGRQCYVICPMVEESENLEAENVRDYSRMLSEEMGRNICVDYLHGKMKQQEKDKVMEGFAKNEIQILVSTTVIEVGIDVPNATVIMIENAERFGLAQLHQLRGRVGRGKYQSYCIFMSASKSDETGKRLDILNHSNDGFYIAGEDLKLRGPGDLFGIRQSGILDFKVGDIFQDSLILKNAAGDAGRILEEDPELNKQENSGLRHYIDRKIDEIMLETTL